MSPSDVILRCLNDSGYTPKRSELGRIIQELGSLSREDSQRVQRVLLRAGLPAADVAIAALTNAEGELRNEIVALLGRFASAQPDPRLFEPLLSALDHGSPRCRRLAAAGLGKLGDPRAEAALLHALPEAPPDLLRAIAEALGKVGSEKALSALAALNASDPELARRREQASLLVQRRLGRTQEATLALDRRLPQPMRMRADCRRGLARLLAQELATFGARVSSDSSVDFEHAGSLRELLVARTALSFGFLLQFAATAGDRSARIASTLADVRVSAAVSAWTRGRPRFRLEWRDAGHQRAATWAVVRELSERTSELVNDPRDANWVLEVSPEPAGEMCLRVVLEPDPRFAYRRKDVPAASHPTVAAALARVAGVRENDVVWDPFVGSGLELCERALLGPYKKLIGSDIDARALSAARANLECASISAFELIEADLRVFTPEHVTLVISNPPMGRRVARDGSLGPLLRSFIERVSIALRGTGRAVFLSPLPERTERWAVENGLGCERGTSVDLGGFDAEIQLLTRN
ncbi:MAG: HEAT repeat domain-containing protein [Myxococcota bacterium]